MGARLAFLVLVIACGCAPQPPAREDAAANARPDGDAGGYDAARPDAWVPRPTSGPVAPIGPSLFAFRDERHVVVADVDGSLLWWVDLLARSSVPLPLPAGALPQRMIQDRAGHVHVVLRGAGGIASFVPSDHVDASSVTIRSVCSAPRGIAEAPREDALVVVCADGVVATLPSEGGEVTRRFVIDDDLRDVAFSNDRAFASRFRSAEVLEIDLDGGTVLGRSRPDPQTAPDPLVFSGRVTPPDATYSPQVAWQLSAGSWGVGIVHQLHRDTPIPARTADAETGLVVRSSYESTELMGHVVQMATSTLAAPDDGSSPLGGTWTTRVEPRQGLALDQVGGQLVPSGEVMPTTIHADATLGSLVLERAPLVLHQRGWFIILDAWRQRGAGRDLFHQIAPSGVACASCHPEGGDDGHVWQHLPGAAVRTQSLVGHVLDAPPFHWEGDLADFHALLDEVWRDRMGGTPFSPSDAELFRAWIDALEPLPPPTPSADAVARGGALFASDAAGCTECHGGATGSDGSSADVGTGGVFQIPPLRGVAYRAPYMHSGCAATLRERFTGEGACTGGERHGHTAWMTADQIDDVVAYLRSR